jgi:hypothetical protein
MTLSRCFYASRCISLLLSLMFDRSNLVRRMVSFKTMNAPAIILGETDGILRLPKAALRNPGSWTQLDSDILAHLIQVQSQIQQSRWNKSNVRFTVQGGQLLDHSFPEFEDFVFVAVYFRQLIAKKDSLLEDAVTRYCRFVDCQIRPAWVQHELAGFKRALDGGAFMLSGYTVRELFDAFMYGAALLHKIPTVGDPTRKRFLDIYDKQPRHALLSSLNMSLKMLMNYVGGVTVVIYRDYSHWLHDYGLPLPDTRWHDKLFEIKTAAESGAADRTCD